MSDEALLPDLEDMNHLAAVAQIRELPADSDFTSLRERERAREKGPRPKVIAELNRRLGLGRDEGLAEVAVALAIPGASSPSDPPPLPEATWKEVNWRGFPLFACRICKHQTFDRGAAFQHSLTHQKTKE